MQVTKKTPSLSLPHRFFPCKRGQEQISISQQLGNYGTTFFSASRQSYWNTSRSDQQISFGLNVPFGDITTSLNYSYSNNIWQNDRDHLLAFTLNVPFSHWMRTDSQSAFRNSNASYSMSNDLKGGMTNLSGVYGTWICPYISRHLLSLNPLLACCRRYSRGER
ncbi:hypothetical protein ABE92_016965 [Escherichia coli]|uniref:Fimbrial outer membrane usher protein n=1 Tax=Escherichia coli TaxID=562 RepID=A0AAP8DMS2_ECOLX|nr:hypothetical protein ABE92_016965 [Escherichia coli]PBN70119.1 hypothetical protein ABE91_021800 [Escherichia coli]